MKTSSVIQYTTAADQRIEVQVNRSLSLSTNPTFLVTLLYDLPRFGGRVGGGGVGGGGGVIFCFLTELRILLVGCIG